MVYGLTSTCSAYHLHLAIIFCRTCQYSLHRYPDPANVREISSAMPEKAEALKHRFRNCRRSIGWLGRRLLHFFRVTWLDWIFMFAVGIIIGVVRCDDRLDVDRS